MARSLRRHKCSDAAARLIEGLTRCLRREEVVQDYKVKILRRIPKIGPTRKMNLTSLATLRFGFASLRRGWRARGLL